MWQALGLEATTRGVNEARPDVKRSSLAKLPPFLFLASGEGPYVDREARALEGMVNGKIFKLSTGGNTDIRL